MSAGWDAVQRQYADVVKAYRLGPLIRTLTDEVETNKPKARVY